MHENIQSIKDAATSFYSDCHYSQFIALVEKFLCKVCAMRIFHKKSILILNLIIKIIYHKKKDS